ncbi:MAG: sensor histidine kinase [Oscillatoriales cyanobacterium]|nr:MAG: sensor histidine kinase [Oscillatoriales cyanobacterium]
MDGWVLPTVGDLLAPFAQEPGGGLPAEAQWQGAMPAVVRIVRAALQAADAVATVTTVNGSAVNGSAANGSAANGAAVEPALQGVVLSGPLPLSIARADGLPLESLAAWTFSSQLWQSLWLLPAAEAAQDCPVVSDRAIGLAPIDPLAAESFCLVRLRDFSLVLSLQDTAQGGLVFRFSFDPQAIAAIWQTLRGRVQLNAPHHLARFDALGEQFPWVEPSYRIVSAFTEQLLRSMPAPAPSAPAEPRRMATAEPPRPARSGEPAIDLELLQALAHSVRTPLATIRTFTRLLMRQRDLQPKAANYVEKIDRECTEQINRFDLIFKAVELETSNSAHLSLAPIPLAQIFQTSVPRWQQQASRHNLELTVKLPTSLPTVASDPSLLDRMLAEIIENLARTLAPGSEVEMTAEVAGSQLKVELRYNRAAATDRLDSLKSIGQLLTFQPETGSFGLNLDVTKNLFQAIGGKLTIRQRSHHAEVMTIFLPLESAPARDR